MTLEQRQSTGNWDSSEIKASAEAEGRDDAGPAAGQAAKNRSAPPSLWLLTAIFSRIIREGTLTFLLPDGIRREFGRGEPAVTVRLADWATVRRLCRNPDLAVGEAYMDGTLAIENGDIYDFLVLCLDNLGVTRGHWVQRAHGLVRRATRRLAQHNPVAKSRTNVAHHYDLSDALYGLFLDSDRQYSCAYFQSPDQALERAQEQKKLHLAAKLLLQPGQRVLDIGSGWGGLARYLARTAHVDVTGLTLSKEQHAYAEKRTQEAGLSDRVRFRLEDYRRESGRYDRIVSVGMFEHVGLGHYREYFDKVRDLLTGDGVALIHTIGNSDGPGSTHPWLRKYIFPGGYSPALSEVVPVIEQSGLIITDVEILRLHYAETLKAWRSRFLANRTRVADLYDERFCRMWEFYLAGCEASFRYSQVVVFQIQLSKRIDAVPLTRDYIGAWERQHG